MSNNLEILKAYATKSPVRMSVHVREDGSMYADLESGDYWSREIELEEEDVYQYWELDDKIPRFTCDYPEEYVSEVIAALAETI